MKMDENSDLGLEKEFVLSIGGQSPPIETQLEQQGLRCSNVDKYEKLIDSLFMLWTFEILTEKEKQKCVRRIANSLKKDVYVVDSQGGTNE